MIHEMDGVGLDIHLDSLGIHFIKKDGPLCGRSTPFGNAGIVVKTVGADLVKIFLQHVEIQPCNEERQPPSSP